MGSVGEGEGGAAWVTDYNETDEVIKLFPKLKEKTMEGVWILPLDDGMLVHRTLPAFSQVALTVCRCPFPLIGVERQCESKVSCDPIKGSNSDQSGV